MGVALPILGYLGQAILFVALQVLFFKQIPLFNSSFCFIYTAAILFLPININRLLLLLIGLIVGLTIDLFYGTLGVHALATLVLSFFRGITLDRLSTTAHRGGYQDDAKPWIAYNGMGWMFLYLVVTLTIHHTVLFFVDAGGVTTFYTTLVAIFGSVIYTFLLLMSIQLLFYKKKVKA